MKNSYKLLYHDVQTSGKRKPFFENIWKNNSILSVKHFVWKLGLKRITIGKGMQL